MGFPHNDFVFLVDKNYTKMVLLPENECPTYFNTYLKLVSEDLVAELAVQLLSYPAFLRTIPKEKELHSYAPGKWTIKEVIGHNTDTERILVTRALRIARNDQTPIPGFNEDDYVTATSFNEKNIEDLILDFELVRQSTISFFKSLTKHELLRIGTASNKKVSVRALFYFMIGHIRHHENILKERYL